MKKEIIKTSRINIIPLINQQRHLKNMFHPTPPKKTHPHPYRITQNPLTLFDGIWIQFICGIGFPSTSHESVTASNLSASTDCGRNRNSGPSGGEKKSQIYFKCHQYKT